MNTSSKTKKEWAKIDARRKLESLEALGVKCGESNQGIVVENEILICKSRSIWKKLGELDWYTYYGLSNLIKALTEGRLDEYRLEQKGSKRMARALPKNNVWKDKKEEKRLKKRYKEKQEKTAAALTA